MKKRAFALPEPWLGLSIVCFIGASWLVVFSICKSPAASASPKPTAERFVIESHDRIGRPSFAIFTDTKTGREYLSITQCGIIELKPQTQGEKP
jgi:hypothetical protein